jgi:NADH dehydrogenase [ubiquinone] 1 alpha subcomplex assembly factor 7
VIVTSTPVEAEIRRLIAVAGPMPVAQYMALCLSHPERGYYMSRDPLGVAGDFTTAPEISQMFGELIGLWAVSIWRLIDSPDRFHLVELGPGRGTMMCDALRAAHVVPGFVGAASIHLVEISPVLQERQRHTLAGLDIAMQWHETLDDVPDGPLIILANEFFDALPVHQAVKQADGWHERVIEIGRDGKFEFGMAARPIPHFERVVPPALRLAPLDALFEWRSDHIALEIARRVVRFNGAALVIDYGHAESQDGDTLQAVGSHSFADPLRAPGAVDLTAHVDFQAIGETAESMGACVHGPVGQGDFLRRLGIESRAAALKKNSTPDQAVDIDIAMARLVEEDTVAMGRLFKAIAISHPKLGPLPGFDG